MNWPSRVTSIAPATPTTAEPSTKTCRWRRVTSLPIASAASRLSRIARIIRPQGELQRPLGEPEDDASSTMVKSSA